MRQALSGTHRRMDDRTGLQLQPSGQHTAAAPATSCVPTIWVPASAQGLHSTAWTMQGCGVMFDSPHPQATRGTREGGGAGLCDAQLR